MLLEKLLMILLQAKGGVVAVVFATGTAAAVTGTIGPGAIDLTVRPVEGSTTTVMITLPSPTPSAEPTASASPTSTPVFVVTTPAPNVAVSCSDEADDRNAALEVLAQTGKEAAAILRVGGSVALANDVDRKDMRETLKEVGHDIRDVLKDAMHDVRDLGKEILGDCDEANVEGLVSRLEHDLDEVAEIHEEFERERATPANGDPLVVTISDPSTDLAEPYRGRVEEAIEEVADLLEDLSEELD